ncbi:MAG TPA: Stp1/IreP family PP2C-type Ser/Thr phosphatase [Bacillaceae bacterium]
MRAVFKTDRGQVRHHNEDNGGIFFNQNGDCLAIVADGMGGHKAGDVASQIAVSRLEKIWIQTGAISTAEEAEKWFKEHVLSVNMNILEHARNNSECDGMGTTLVAAICNETFATVANIGDSRCYVMNDNGFHQLTEDHSLVNELVKTGQISREDAENHPRKNVLLKALGTESDVEMDIRTITFEEGDKILLCSDGLSNKVSEQELLDILSSKEGVEEKADRLIHLANQYGGEDNISLVILEHGACSESGCKEC